MNEFNSLNLQRLISEAIVSNTFKEKLLGDHEQRRQAIAGFDLSEQERNAVLSIDATSLQDFAEKLQHWIDSQSQQKREPARFAGPLT